MLNNRTLIGYADPISGVCEGETPYVGGVHTTFGLSIILGRQMGK